MCGATCAALASGLVEAGYDRPVYCFDRWKANRGQVRKAAERAGLSLRRWANLEPVFRH